MRKLLLTLLCSMPVMATSITYDIRSGNLGFTVTTPDFLPNLEPDKTVWRILSNETSYYNCGAMAGLSFCDGTYLELQGPNTYVSMRGYTSSYNYQVLEGFFFGADLAHIGAWLSTTGDVHLTIAANNDPVTYTPEPSTFIVAGMGLLLVGVKNARRLLNLAV